MNPGLVVKLRPSGPWRIGPDSGARNRVDVVYHSDSLYSAVTAAMARLGWLEEWLDATARPGASAVSFGSCFPFLDDIDFVIPPRSMWPPVSNAARAARVRWKSARFVPLSVVQTILAGKRLDENQWSVDGPSDCLVPAGKPGPFRTAVRWSAGIDRLTGTSERHSTGCLEFRAGAGLWTVVSFADEAAQARWSDPVKAAFRLLADTGFGGERSRGWGRSEAPEFTEGMLPALILPPVIRAATVRERSVVEPMVAPPAAESAVEESAVAEVAPTAEEEAPAAVVPEIAEVAPTAVEEAPAAVVTEIEEAAPSAPEDAPVAVVPEIVEAAPTAVEDAPAAVVPEIVEAAPTAVEEAPAAIVPETVEAAAPEVDEAKSEPEVESIESVQAPLPDGHGSESEAVQPDAVQAEAARVEPAPAPAASHAPTHPHWLLSVFTPAATDTVDWGRGNYTVLARGGRVDSPAGSGELKKQIQMVAEGSVVYAETTPRGSAADVAPDGFAHPVFRAGFAVAIPLPEVS